MTVHRGISGISVVLALAACAIAAGSASAENLRDYTCKNVGGGTQVWGDAHCKNSTGPPYTGNFAGILVNPKTRTNIKQNNVLTATERSPWFLKATVAGLGLTLEAKLVSAEGWTENNEGGGEEWVEEELESLVLEEVSANQNCAVTGLPGGAGKLEAQPLMVTTKGQGASGKLTPKEGTKVAEFELSGAGCPAALKGKYPIFGSVQFVPSGATRGLTHSEITTAKTLRLKNETAGPLVGIEGFNTEIGQHKNGSDTEWTPILIR